ncbi:MAG: ComEC/Rec2 family competence protein [Patescibacteria group bacterium]
MTRQITFIVIFFLLLILALRFFFLYHNRSKLYNGQEVSFEETLLGEPQISGQFQKFSANYANGERISITIPRYPEFGYAQTLKITGTIKSQLLKNGNVIITMFLPKIEAVQNYENLTTFPIKFILAVTSFVRQNMISLFEKTLPPTSASLLLGIVFGIKGEMPTDFLDNLRMSGVMHVIAASGMNVTMTGGFLFAVFSVLLKRRMALLVSIFGLIFYAVLSGLQPSILRATIMGILVFSAQILGRQTLASYALILAGYIMLFISPLLLFDIGFQLSFLSTLGILYLKPFFGKSVFIDDVSTTFSAQIMTLPVLLSNFGSYSLLSVLVNALVLWTVPFLMILGALGAIFGMVAGFAGQLFLYLSFPLLLYFEKVVDFFAKLGGLISIATLPWQIIFGYYVIIFSAVIFLRQRFNQNRKNAK